MAAGVPKDTYSAALSNRRGSGRVTIKDVALASGVSLMTVSRALRSPELVSDKTLGLIRDAVEKLGYLPNRLAGSLSGSPTQQVAVLIPSISNAVFSSMLNGLVHILEPAGFQIMLGNFRYNPALAERQAMSFLGWMPDAMVIVGPLPKPARTLAQRNGVPVVEVLELLSDPVDINVGISHEAAGYASASHLLSCGYRDIAVITAYLSVDRRAAQRLIGFNRKLAEFGVPAPVVHEIGDRSSIVGGRSCLENMLISRKLPEVVFCTNDDIAFGVLAACMGAGVSVPGEFGIMGFNGLEIAMNCYPQLTTTHVDMYGMGLRSAEAILARLSGQNSSQVCIESSFSVIPGATTRKSNMKAGEYYGGTPGKPWPGCHRKKF